MASEGLDIKSLTTLFMITPMTNIEQSVGRILRQKHEFDPVVVDIIDTHDNFQRQWTKRKNFFKKQNYKIIQNKSSTYDSNVSKWKVTFEPTNYTCTKQIDLEEDDDDDLNEEETDGKNNKLSSGQCLLKFKK